MQRRRIIRRGATYGPLGRGQSTMAARCWLNPGAFGGS